MFDSASDQGDAVGVPHRRGAWVELSSWTALDLEGRAAQVGCHEPAADRRAREADRMPKLARRQGNAIGMVAPLNVER
jgi:hypothetical protein